MVAGSRKKKWLMEVADASSSILPARFQHSCCPFPARCSRGCNITPRPLPGSRSPRTQQKTLLIPARGHHGHSRKRSSFQPAVTTGRSKTLLVPARGHHIKHRRSRSQQQKGCNRRSEVLEPGRRKAATTSRRCWNRATKKLLRRDVLLPPATRFAGTGQTKAATGKTKQKSLAGRQWVVDGGECGGSELAVPCCRRDGCGRRKEEETP